MNAVLSLVIEGTAMVVDVDTFGIHTLYFETAD
jgi:hypothetical protein